jgi:hypothetical protein
LFFGFFEVRSYLTLLPLSTPSDSSVSEDAGIEHRTVGTFALAVSSDLVENQSFLVFKKWIVCISSTEV